ncbi:uncharacterized protein METZ01_LOCUS160115, partial [marine metagenome]
VYLIVDADCDRPLCQAELKRPPGPEIMS